MNQDLPPAQRALPLTSILLVVLGITTVIFAGLFLFSYNKASSATNNSNQVAQSAAIQAAQKQKKTDLAANIAAMEIPYRTYQAPTAYGSFIVSFPKSWSSRVSEAAENKVQVNLSVNPDFVRYKGDSALPVALRVRLIQQTSNSFIAEYAESIKSRKLVKTTSIVSGQNAIVLTGNFRSDDDTSGFVRLVAVPVRDKVIVFTCENGLYTQQFEEVIAQAKIIP